MKHHVVVAEPARNDANDIYNWIATHSIQGAARWWEALSNALDSLAVNPEYLGEAPESDAFDETLRQVLFKTRRGNTYRVLFVIRNDVVHVLRIRGPGQDFVAPDKPRSTG